MHLSECEYEGAIQCWRSTADYWRDAWLRVVNRNQELEREIAELRRCCVSGAGCGAVASGAAPDGKSDVVEVSGCGRCRFRVAVPAR